MVKKEIPAHYGLQVFAVNNVCLPCFLNSAHTEVSFYCSYTSRCCCCCYYDCLTNEWGQWWGEGGGCYRGWCTQNFCTFYLWNTNYQYCKALKTYTFTQDFQPLEGFFFCIFILSLFLLQLYNPDKKKLYNRLNKWLSTKYLSHVFEIFPLMCWLKR